MDEFIFPRLLKQRETKEYGRKRIRGAAAGNPNQNPPVDFADTTAPGSNPARPLPKAWW